MDILTALAVITLTWTNPTTYTDNTTLPASHITGTRIEYGTCNGNQFATKSGEWIQSGSATTSTSPNLANQIWCFRAYTRVQNGTESQASNVAIKDNRPVPNPPTLSAQEGIAYNIVKRRNRLVMSPVGTIPIGTECDATQQINGYNVVDRDKVEWSGLIKPDIVVAKCT